MDSLQNQWQLSSFGCWLLLVGCLFSDSSVVLVTNNQLFLSHSSFGQDGHSPPTQSSAFPARVGSAHPTGIERGASYQSHQQPIIHNK